MADYSYPGEELDIFQRARNWKRYIKKQVRPFLHGKILEVGAGIGTNTILLFSGREMRWDCVEPDASLVERLEARISARNLSGRVRTVHGTLQSLPKQARYDTVLYIDVLEHIPDDAGELKAASMHLNPDGHLLVLAPAHEPLMSPFDQHIGHLRRYSRSSLLAVAPDWLRPVRLRYLDSAGLTASLMNRHLLKSAMPTASNVLLWDRLLVPCSFLLDPLLNYRVGKSLLAVWRPRLPRAQSQAAREQTA